MQTSKTIVDTRRVRLVRVHDVPESCSVFKLTHALVYASTPEGVLLVRNRETNVWELPGGLIDPEETARTCAAREFREETGVEVPPLHWRGVIELNGMPNQWRPTPYVDFGALYYAELARLLNSEYQTDEIAEIAVWPVASLPDRTSKIDAELLDFLR